MRCYLVTFFCERDDVIECKMIEIPHSFSAIGISDLTEQIMEFQDDLESGDFIVLSKSISEVVCEKPKYKA